MDLGGKAGEVVEVEKRATQEGGQKQLNTRANLRKKIRSKWLFCTVDHIKEC